MSTSNDGSESVDEFLARIASLKEGRDEASEEKTRRMEEDFQKSRKERQARRLGTLKSYIGIVEC
jgi:DNA integrity scanning protein DisA with diadenylate cyclase activity